MKVSRIPLTDQLLFAVAYACLLVFIVAWFFGYYVVLLALEILKNTDEMSPTGLGWSSIEYADWVMIAALGSAMAFVVLQIQLSYRLLAQSKAIARMQRLLNHAMVHDLRNPLTLIRGMAEVAASPHHDKIEKKEAIATIYDNANRLIIMISNLLDEAENQIHEVSLEVCDISVLIEKSLAAHKVHAEKKGIHLSYVESGKQILARVDQVSFTRIMTNLISNAIKYSNTQDTITIGVSPNEPDSELLVYVADTGPGIPPNAQKQIFKPFYQADKSHKNSSGLGLTSSKLLVEEMGGRIWFESGAGGTTFNFTVLTP